MSQLTSAVFAAWDLIRDDLSALPTTIDALQSGLYQGREARFGVLPEFLATFFLALVICLIWRLKSGVVLSAILV